MLVFSNDAFTVVTTLQIIVPSVNLTLWYHFRHYKLEISFVVFVGTLLFRVSLLVIIFTATYIVGRTRCFKNVS